MKSVVLGVTSDLSIGLMRGFPELLASTGWDVHIVSAPGPRTRDITHPGVTVHTIPMARAPHPARDVISLVRWISLLRKLRPDVVSVGTPKAGMLGTFAARFTGVPVRIYLLRGLRLETSSGPALWLFTLIERLVMSAATDVVAVSESLRAAALARGLTRPDKIRVVGLGSSNGVDGERFDARRFEGRARDDLRSDLGLAPDVPVVGFVGRLTPDKGLLVLSESLSLLRAAGTRVQLLVVGAGDSQHAGAAMERLRETGVPLVFTGFIADPERAYAAMELLCIPSLREGFVNVALEASALSVPIVGAASTGVVDAVSHGVTGLLVPAGDSKSFADAIQTILTDHPLARRLGQGGAEWVRRHFERANVQAAYARDLDDSRTRNANKDDTKTPTRGSTS